MTDPLVRSLPRTRRQEVDGTSFAFFNATTPHRFITDLSGDRHSLLVLSPRSFSVPGVDEPAGFRKPEMRTTD